MTDGETLFLILILLYFSDCLVWVGKRTVIFVSPWCRKWRATSGSPYLGNANGSLTILNPFPPLGTAFLCRSIPISFSPVGVCDFSLQAADGSARTQQSGNVLTYAEIIETQAQDKYLLLNGSRFAKCDTPDQAQCLIQLIQRIRDEPKDTREQVIRIFIASLFAKNAAQSRFKHVSALVREIRWSCLTFFLFLYVAVPALVCLYGLQWFIIPAALIMLAGAVYISIQFFHAHKALYPLGKSDRIGHIIKMVLCPPAAIRAHDVLTAEALSNFHPVLLAHLLLGNRSAGLVGSIIRDLKHPLSYGLTDSRALTIMAWYATAELDACEIFLNEESSTLIEEILRPPQSDDVACTYCPRCLCQFIASSGKCPDCPGVELLPIHIIQPQAVAHE